MNRAHEGEKFVSEQASTGTNGSSILSAHSQYIKLLHFHLMSQKFSELMGLFFISEICLPDYFVSFWYIRFFTKSNVFLLEYFFNKLSKYSSTISTSFSKTRNFFHFRYFLLNCFFVSISEFFPKPNRFFVSDMLGIDEKFHFLARSTFEYHHCVMAQWQAASGCF